MEPQLEFQYGNQTVHCRRDEDGFWYYRHGERKEMKGPPVGPNDSAAVLEVTVRQMLPARRDPAEPGEGLYRLLGALPDEIDADWIRAGRCYPGEPDEETRDEAGVEIRLRDPGDEEREPVAVHSALLQRVEVEDCRELRRTGSSPWDL